LCRGCVPFPEQSEGWMRGPVRDLRKRMRAAKRFVYIIKSERTPDEYYVGVTAEPDARLRAHNAGLSTHTAQYRPWRTLVLIEFDEEEPALRFELYLKSGSGRESARRHFRQTLRHTRPARRPDRTRTGCATGVGGPLRSVRRHLRGAKGLAPSRASSTAHSVGRAHVSIGHASAYHNQPPRSCVRSFANSVNGRPITAWTRAIRRLSAKHPAQNFVVARGWPREVL
jgi:predicted GIY-YIG superfamily endonuclease